MEARAARGRAVVRRALSAVRGFVRVCAYLLVVGFLGVSFLKQGFLKQGFLKQGHVMAESVTAPSPAESAEAVPPKRRRLTAEARKSSILAAARRAFTETGDMNGTTIKLIAERSGISEGVIYRHFESKDQLFFEAVVEPLKKAVDDLVAASAMVDRDEPLTPQRQLDTMVGLYRQLTSTLEGILPLLGLVLFGDPQVAKKFYRENFAVAMDRLAEAWREVEDRYGFPFESPDISARAVMGMALIMALEVHHGKKFDRNRAVTLISEGTVKGFFPALEPTSKRR
jgi:AcrR family transcriptional regulator